MDRPRRIFDLLLTHRTLVMGVIVLLVGLELTIIARHLEDRRQRHRGSDGWHVARSQLLWSALRPMFFDHRKDVEAALNGGRPFVGVTQNVKIPPRATFGATQPAHSQRSIFDDEPSFHARSATAPTTYVSFRTSISAATVHASLDGWTVR